MRVGRWLPGSLAVALLALAFGPAGAGPEDVTVGAVRATLSRSGARLKARPEVLSPTTTALAYGTRVRVEQVRQPWIEVTLVEGEGAGTRGWLKAAETVEPSALGPREDVRAVAAAPLEGGGVSTRDISAAGRRLDRETEEGFAAANPDVAAGYPILDRLEAANRAVDAADLASFIRDGRLGHPGGE